MSVENISNSSSLFSGVQEALKTQFVDKNTTDFSEFLKNNFSKIDEDRDNNLSVSEVKNATEKMDLSNFTNLFSNVDLNNDNLISLSELDSKSAIGETIKGVVEGLTTEGASTSSILTNATERISKIYKLNEASSKLLDNIIEKIV